MRSFVKTQRSEAVLAIDHQEFVLRLLQMTDGFISIQSLEAQSLGSKEQNRSWNWRLANGCFVEVSNGLHFCAGKPALKSLLASFDSGNELRHVVIGREFLSLDLLTLIIKPADKTNLR